MTGTCRTPLFRKAQRFVVLALSVLLAACSTANNDVRCLQTLTSGVVPGPFGILQVRAAPQETPLRLRLNVPAYRLDVLIDDSLAHSYLVAVGSRKYPTPTGEFEISEITWNPWWIPPPSDWARKYKPTPPGPGNPLGKVKLQFRPYYFLHGTPDTSSLGHAASHGCVRLLDANAIELARLVESQARLDTAEAIGPLNGKSREVRLDRPIPIEIRYDLVEVRDTLVLVHQDIYRLRRDPVATLILAALTNSGIAPGHLDTAAVQRFANVRASSTAVSTLLRAH